MIIIIIIIIIMLMIMIVTVIGLAVTCRSTYRCLRKHTPFTPLASRSKTRALPKGENPCKSLPSLGPCTADIGHLGENPIHTYQCKSCFLKKDYQTYSGV